MKVLEEKLVKRKIAPKALSHGNIEAAAGGTARQTLKLQQGIPTDKAREIVKFIKDNHKKAQASIQGDQVKVLSKPARSSRTSSPRSRSTTSVSRFNSRTTGDRGR